MKTALLALAVLAAVPACAQRVAEPHPGLTEFSRICLEPHTINFVMLQEEAARLGLKTEPNRGRLPEEDIARFDLKGDDQYTLAAPAYILHGDTPDPNGYSIWSAPEKREALVQRVDVGRGVFGAPGFAAPSTFCSVLTMSDPEKAWASFQKAFPGALYIGETHGGMFGRMKSWALDASWAPGHTAIVTIADCVFDFPKGIPEWKGASGRKDAPAPRAFALFSIEVVTQQDFERLGKALESLAPPV